MQPAMREFVMVIGDEMPPLALSTLGARCAMMLTANGRIGYWSLMHSCRR